ncbi:hypothetical protein Patl1_07222 [Pistacia atlantica]|uniref:Uncharacterized protein n=1 Tax=Pistacia atlantica TaxID=434234 RepID=A0ACC1AIE8_9ROSI|nr:hypothetical protein Patl1_07222 [Pistacia atlantica]
MRSFSGAYTSLAYGYPQLQYLFGMISSGRIYIL